ncbi:MAG: P-loop NTPase fold protein [Candidatus Omnitrophota bacterium]|jgi:hypothetical protein
MTDDNLKLARDIPEFSSGYDEKKDKFNHRVYADTLVNVIKNNDAPLVIGLLGDWGSGKSTILNIFQNKIKDSCEIAYFNAWKYSKDSFRRQFLIECAKALIKDGDERNRFIKDLNTRFIKDLNTQVTSLKDLSKALNNIKINAQYLIPLLVFLSIALTAMFVVSFVYGFTKSSILAILTPLIVTTLLRDPFLKLIEKLMVGVFKIDVDPKIIFPEQFQEKFLEIIKGANREIIFIIDDIDRCPDEMIMEILDSAKTFFTSYDNNIPEFKKCYFILAMDDKAVIEVFKNKRSKKYEAEQILKFVDVNIKLTSLSHADLIEFSKVVARETSISEAAVQIGIYGGFDTPRKIKHFLNSFKVMYSICKKRKEEGFFNFDIDKGVSSLAKILVLQMSFPDEFEKLKEDSNLFKKWESESHRIFGGGSFLGAPLVNLELLKFLYVTRFTQIPDLQAILHLKIPAHAVGLQNYSEFKEALLEGNLAKIQSLLKEHFPEDQKDNLKELIRDILVDQNPTESFLANILTASLEIYRLIDFKTIKKEFAEIVISPLLRYRRILDFDSDVVFALVDILNTKETERPRLIELGIEDLIRKPIPEYSAKFINTLYKNNDIETAKGISSRINEIFEGITEKDPNWVIQVLKLINLPEGKEFKTITNKIPSLNLVATKLLSRIDEKDTECNFYNQIIDVVFNFWDSSYIKPLSEKCQKLLTYWYQQPISSTNEGIKLIIRIIKDMPDWLTKTESDHMIDYIWPIYERMKNLSEKRELLEMFCIVSFCSNSPSNYSSMIIQQSKMLSPDDLEKLIIFIKEQTQDDNWWEKLKLSIVETNLGEIQSSPHESSLAKFKIIYKNEKSKLDNNRIINIIINVLHSEPFIDIWKSEITKVSKDNKDLSSLIFTHAKTFIKEQFSLQHKEKLLTLLIALCNDLKDNDKKQEMGNFIFELAKNIGNSNLSGIGRRYLSKAKELLGDVFKTKLNTEIQDLCPKETSEFYRFKDLINDYLTFKQDWEHNTKLSFIDAIIRLVNSNNPSYFEMASSLINKLETVPKEKVQDLKNASGIISRPAEKDSWMELIGKLKSE